MGVLRGGLALVACVLGGCGGGICPGCPPNLPDPTRIEVQDKNVFVPSVRAAWNFKGGEGAPSVPRTGQAVEVGVVRASGGSTQTGSAGGGPFVLGDGAIAVPETVRNDFHLSGYDAVWRWRKFFRRGRVGLEGSAGVAAYVLDMRVASATRTLSERITDSGINAGGGLIWRIRDATTVQLRGASFIGTGPMLAHHADVLVEQALARNAAVRAGYSWWYVKLNRTVDLSDVLVQFRGPALGLQVSF